MKITIEENSTGSDRYPVEQLYIIHEKRARGKVPLFAAITAQPERPRAGVDSERSPCAVE
jgi:hypothetical protein